MSAINCKKCEGVTDTLALFPGDICLDCYKLTPAAYAPITAQQLTRMWGG